MTRNLSFAVWSDIKPFFHDCILNIPTDQKRRSESNELSYFLEELFCHPVYLNNKTHDVCEVKPRLTKLLVVSAECRIDHCYKAQYGTEENQVKHRPDQMILHRPCNHGHWRGHYHHMLLSLRIALHLTLRVWHM